MSETSDNKQKIRTDLLQKRRLLTPEEQKSASDVITQRILALDIFQSASTIGLYHAFAGEVDLESLWHIASQLGKKTGFPVIDQNSNPNKDQERHQNKVQDQSVNNNQMDFFESSPNDPEQINRFQIREPLSDNLKTSDSSAQCIKMEQFDCLFIPLVAFDKRGYRLGMGKGYYDRALKNSCLGNTKRPYCIGVAYDFQCVQLLPRDPWDVTLDRVITEQKMYRFNSDDHKN